MPPLLIVHDVASAGCGVSLPGKNSNSWLKIWVVIPSLAEAGSKLGKKFEGEIAYVR